MQSQSQEAMNHAEIFMQGVLDNFTVTQQMSILNTLMKNTMNQRPDIQKETKKPKDCPTCGIPMDLSRDEAFNETLVRAEEVGKEYEVEPCIKCCCLCCGIRMKDWYSEHGEFRCYCC